MRGYSTDEARTDFEGNIQKKSGNHWGWIFLLVLVFAALIFLYYSERVQREQMEVKYDSLEVKYDSLYDSLDVKYDNLKDEYDNLKDEYDNLKDEYDNLEDEYDNLEDEYDNYQSKVSVEYPLIITKIEIGNEYYDGEMNDDFGEKIHSWNTMFLQPRITYYGLKSSTSIRLNVKLFDSDGVMSTGKTSPEGYTYANDRSIDFGHNTCVLSGWGSENKGRWKAGSYRIEIWYSDVCLKSFKFTIY